MSNEISASAGSGLVLYAVVRSAGAQPWNTATAALETYADGHWASYALALAEQGVSGYYVGSLPTGLPAGLYAVEVRQRAFGTADLSDPVVAVGPVTWTGSAEAFVLADSSGRPTLGGYASGQDPATLLLVTPANKLATDGTGRTTVGSNADKTGYGLNLGQAVPTANAAQTVGDALNAARAQGFGKWLLVGNALTLYAPDGTTAVRTFALDSTTAPTSRT